MVQNKRRRRVAWAIPSHEDVDKTSVSVEFRRDVFFDPLVDGLWRRIYFDLFQQLLFQFHERKQKAQTFAFQNLQHPVFVLVNFYGNTYIKTTNIRTSKGWLGRK